MTAKKLNQNILIELIDLSAGTQQRQLSPEVISHYTDLREDGIVLPSVELIWTGKEYILWDGFHRIAVAKNLGEAHVRANVEIGSLQQAVWMSYHANGQHGFPRQARATKFILEKIFAHPELSKKTVSEIARHVGCSRKHASNVKNEGKRNPGCAFETAEATANPEMTEAQNTSPTRTPKIETEPKSPLHDDEGKVIPPHLADRFLSRAVIRERINDIDKVKNSVMNSIAGSEMTYALLNQTGFQADFNNLRARLKSCIPHAICCYCEGGGCNACHDSGFLNEASWKAAPKNSEIENRLQQDSRSLLEGDHG